MNHCIETELQKHLSNFILKKFSKEYFITITNVVMEGNKKAVVFVSIFDTKGTDTKEIIDKLNSEVIDAKKYLVEKKLKIKYIPNIKFQISPKAW